jgi:hypothetical protein
VVGGKISLEASQMTLIGHVRNGVVVFDQPLQVPDGTVARVDLLAPGENAAVARQPRQGGQWKGRVVIALDFDTLPDDIQEAFGMKDS